MAVPYEKIVAEDLNLGHGSATVTMPAGGTATGNKIGIHSLLGDVYNVVDFGAVGDGATDDSTAILAAYAAIPATGGVVQFEPGKTYRTTQRWNVLKPNVTIEGNGADLLFEPTDVSTHDRALVIHAGDSGGFSALRNVSGAIAVGATAFTLQSSGDGTDLVAGDWLTVEETDGGATPNGEICIFDWVQVASVSGTTVNVLSAFRTAFPGTHNTVQFRRVINLVENITVRNLRIRTTNLTNTLLAVSLGIARKILLHNVVCAPVKGNAISSYRTADLTLSDCHQDNTNGQATEIAATVDFKAHGNTFAIRGVVPNRSALTLDFGTAFFSVIGNTIGPAGNIAVQMVYGCHDGIFAFNNIDYVHNFSIDASGIAALGCQRVHCVYNVLRGGAGATATGIGFADTSGFTTNFPTQDNVIAHNIIKNFAVPYSTLDADDVYITASSGKEVQAHGIGLGTSPAMTTLLTLASATDADVAIRMTHNGVGNWFTGIDFAGAAALYFIGFNDVAARDFLFDQNGLFAIKNGLSAGGLQVGATGTPVKLYRSATAAKAAAAYSANPIAANSTATFTITVAGATGGHIAVASPDQNPGAGLVWSAYVSAADTVTVVVANVTGAGIVPATATWRVSVFQH